MIKVAVSACFMYPDLSRSTFGAKTLSYLEADMARYISQPGIMPVLIPELESNLLDEILAETNGLLLQGGADLAPETYGEQPINAERWPGDKLRDEYELDLIDRFIKAGKPVFGICRGFQILNAYFGGTLFQDLATQRPTSIKHRDAAEYDRVNHGINFPKGSFFEEIHGASSGRVNSVHQGIKDLGAGLSAQALCEEDGLIEAFMHDDYDPGKVMAVQWHPEFFHTLGNQLTDPMIPLNNFLSHIKK
jgi:putative glutamine amidotransferase